jgi:hypothetical protein
MCSYVWALHHAVEHLPAEARPVLAAVIAAAPRGGASAAAPLPAAGTAAPAAGAPPAAVGAPPQPAPAHVQRTLSRPIYDLLVKDFRDNVLTTDDQRATHLSQAGLLGTAWMRALPRRGDEIDAGDFRLGLAFFLGVAIAGFAGARCKCGATLTAVDGAAHVNRCTNHHNTTVRHNDFGKGWCKAIRTIHPGSWPMPGEDGIVDCGTRTVWMRQADGTQAPVTKGVFPDRMLSGMPGDGPGVRWLLDFRITDAGKGAAAAAAAAADAVAAGRQPRPYLPATVPNHAAAAAHAEKLSFYSGVQLREGDIVLPVAVELHGGLLEGYITSPDGERRASAWERMRLWARARCQGDTQRTETLLWVCRRELSLTLFRARVGHLRRALERLGGWAARAEGEGQAGRRQAGRGAAAGGRIMQASTSASALAYAAGQQRNVYRGWVDT